MPTHGVRLRVNTGGSMSPTSLMVDPGYNKLAASPLFAIQTGVCDILPVRATRVRERANLAYVA